MPLIWAVEKLTESEAAIERIERLINVLLEKQERMLLMQSDLLESLKSRGKKELPEETKIKRSWKCEWCQSPENPVALEPWGGRICQSCVDKELFQFPKGTQDRAAGSE